MKLQYQQLATHLNQAQFASCYWLSGDEPFLLLEAKQNLLEAAKEKGYAEYLYFDNTASQDWPSVFAELQSKSLFSEKRVIEFRLATGKLPEAAATLIATYLTKPNADVILLITSSKLEQGVANSAYYQKIEQNGVVLPIWPLDVNQLPSWIAARLQKYQLKVSLEGLHELVDMTEGNLAAAANEVEKLALLYPAGVVISREELRQVMVSQSRYDIYSLADAFLAGKLAKQLKILKTLRQEGAELTLVLWVLCKELRNLSKLQAAERDKQPMQKLWLSLGIFDKRKPLYLQALKSKKDFAKALIKAAELDRMVKGYAPGNAWQAIEAWLVGI